MKLLFSLLIALFLTEGSQFDPHLPYPSKTFFEGWYTRIFNSDSTASFGVIFGLTENPKGTAFPRAMVTLMYQNQTCPTCSIESYDVYPEPSTIEVSVKGGKILTDPDFTSRPDWGWHAPGVGFYSTKGQYTTMNFTAGPITFTAEVAGFRPWRDDGSGYGPAGILDRLPTPLHWFVHSLGHPESVISYSWFNSKTGLKIAGRGGAAHQEKNWGDSFPKKWIWGEALDQKTGVALAVSGGDLSFSVGPTLPIELSHLIGYRNPATNISWDFTPADSRLNKTIDACNGLFSFDVYHNILPRRLSVVMKAEPKSLETCILGPGFDGFSGMSVESFVTHVEIKSYRHFPIGSDQLLDHQIVLNGGLEFGGDYRCKDPDACAAVRS